MNFTNIHMRFINVFLVDSVLTVLDSHSSSQKIKKKPNSICWHPSNGLYGRRRLFFCMTYFSSVHYSSLAFPHQASRFRRLLTRRMKINSKDEIKNDQVLYGPLEAFDIALSKSCSSVQRQLLYRILSFWRCTGLLNPSRLFKERLVCEMMNPNGITISLSLKWMLILSENWWHTSLRHTQSKAFVKNLQIFLSKFLTNAGIFLTKAFEVFKGQRTLKYMFISYLSQPKP